MPIPLWMIVTVIGAGAGALLSESSGSSGSNSGPSKEEAERRRRAEVEAQRQATRDARKREELEEFCDRYDIPLGSGNPDTAVKLVGNYIQELIETNVAVYSTKYTQSKNAKQKLKRATTVLALKQACKGTGVQTKRLAKPFMQNSQSEKPIVAVMGQMNGGKSALLNGIVGKEIFTVADRRETAKIKKHETDHFIFMDTPGSDALFEDEKAALEGLQEANAFIFVHSVEQGDLTQPEIRYLQTAIDRILGSELLSRNFFVVLNKADKGKGDAIQKVVEIQLKELGIQPRAVLQTSAKRMTDAAKLQDQHKQSKLLAKSGLFEVQSVLGDLHHDMAEILIEQQKQQLEKLRAILLAEVEKVFQKQKKSYQVEQKRIKKENKELKEAWSQFLSVYNNI